jgi:hypothetical protein
VSGEAGHMLEGSHFSVFVGSGISENIALPPGGDLGDYFHRQSLPFAEWLERARPQLEALFANSGLPLEPLTPPFEQVDGAIIDHPAASRLEEPDQKAAHFKRYYRGGKLLLFADGSRRLKDFRSLRLRIAVSRRVHQHELDTLLDRVAAIVNATAR